MPVLLEHLRGALGGTTLEVLIVRLLFMQAKVDGNCTGQRCSHVLQLFAKDINLDATSEPQGSSQSFGGF